MKAIGTAILHQEVTAKNLVDLIDLYANTKVVYVQAQTAGNVTCEELWEFKAFHDELSTIINQKLAELILDGEAKT